MPDGRPPIAGANAPAGTGTTAADRGSLDVAAVLALNAAHELETSPLDAAALRALLAQAIHVGLVAGGRDAFMIALDERADYGSPNFRWFRDRYPRFAYVDRVVVAPAARGHGLARRLYAELFAVAAGAGYGCVCCEVNVDPPNPSSAALHVALGFAEVGRARIGTKGVAYLVRSLTPAGQAGRPDRA